MVDVAQSTICSDSDFDTRLSGKKICYTNGLEFEVVGYETLRVKANSNAHTGSYELWIWSYHVDSTGTILWSSRATPMTVTIRGNAIDYCSLEVEDAKI